MCSIRVSTERLYDYKKYKIYKVYHKEVVSAKNMNHPKFQEMIQYIKEKQNTCL